MKKWAIKLLLGALNIFTDIVMSKINVEWVKKSVGLTIKRLALFGEALTDADPNDKAQIEQIAKQTLLSPEFQELERSVVVELVSKIENQKLANMLLQTNDLRLQLFAVLGDDNKQNSEQLKAVLETFVKTEEFDSIVIGLAELLADKYAKNETMRLFIISLVESLVNSDDND